MSTRVSFTAVAAALILAAIAWSGCGSSESSAPPPNYAKALIGSPPRLAAIHKQANDLLPGGTEAFEDRIASLHGYPTVVNVWASWCGPCRFEFPTLQKLSAQYGKRVAFLGVNAEDSDAHAASFLENDPVPYPSYTDPNKDIFDSLGAIGLPDTAFYNGSGKLLYVKQGPYVNGSELEADVRHYALNSG